MSLKKNIAVNYLGQAWVAILGFAFLPVYIQYLGMEAYGLIGIFIAIQAWLTLLDMGMTPTLNREMARFTAGVHTPQSIRDLLRSLEIIAVTVAAAIAGAMVLGSSWLASDWLKADKLPLELVTQSISIIGFVVALRFVEGIYRGSLFGLQQQLWYNGASVVIASLRQAVVIGVLVWVSPTITAFFIAQAGFSILTVFVFARRIYSTLPPAQLPSRFSRSAITEVWRFAGGMIGITFLALLLTQVDKILLSKILSLEAFGYYMLAGAVSTVIYMIIGPITQAIYPKMIELLARGDKPGLSRIYHQGSQLVTVLSGPAVMLLVFFSDGIVFMWSGNGELATNTAPILSVLAFGTFLNGLMYMPYHLQLTYGQTRLSIVTNAVAVAILVPATFYFVPTYGAKGAAWIWVFLNLGYIAVVIRFLLGKLMPGEAWKWPLLDVLAPLGAAAGVCAVMTVLSPAVRDSRISWFVFLLITGILATTAAAFCAGTLRPIVLQMLKQAPGALRRFNGKH